MDTEQLEKRIKKIEEKLSQLTPGTNEYAAVAADHKVLVDSLNSIRKTDADIQFKAEQLKLEQEKNEAAKAEAEKRTEIDRKSKSFVRKAAEITLAGAVSVLIPVWKITSFEEAGNVVRGKAFSFIGKLKR